jgi:phosphate transport system permease protein
VATPDAVVAPPGATPVDLRASSHRVGELLIRGVLGLCALISVVTTVGIVASLLLPAVEFFSEVNPIDFFTGRNWAPLFEPAHFGVLPLISATFVVTFWALLVAVPFGLGTAIYLSEYATPRTRNVLKPILEILAGVPTVVYGYFALTAVTPLLRELGVQVEIFNALAGGLVMGVMLIPTVASLSEDAMAAVPQALRDGAYGLGADKLQVALRVVVPAAISGIIASFVLAISRAVGETMIVLIAVGQLANLSFDPRETMETLTAFIGATGNGDLPTGSIEYKTIFAVGLTLFAITFVMNIVAIRLVRKYREVYD